MPTRSPTGRYSSVGDGRRTQVAQDSRRDFGRADRDHRVDVAGAFDGRVEQREQPVEIATRACLDESLADLLLQRGVDREAAGRRLRAAGCGAPGWPAAGTRPVLRPTIVGDVVEGVLEHVVQHERGSLRRAQPFEQRMHRQRDVVDERHLTRRVDCVRIEGIRTDVERVGRAPAPRAEAIEAQPAS